MNKKSTLPTSACLVVISIFLVTCQLQSHDEAIVGRSESLREYLGQITSPNPTSPQVKTWITQLGDDSYSLREAAMDSLIKLQKIPIDPLLEASQSKNLEQASRASRILKIVVPRQRQNIEAALQTIEQYAISGLAKEILLATELVLELETDDSELETKILVDLARAALCKTVTSDDLPILQSAIEDQWPARTTAVYALSSKGLPSTQGVREQLDEVWNTGCQLDKLASAEALLARGEKGALQRLVTLLESSDFKIRTRAARLLWHATGQNLTFDPNGPLKSRLKQVAGWQAWVRELGADAQVRTDVRLLQRPRGRTIVASYVSNEVVEYDLLGNKKWRIPLNKASGCWGLVTGERVVFSWRESQLIVYAAGDGLPKKLWQLNERCEASPIPDGDMLVWGESIGVRRYAPTGQLLWSTGDILWQGQKRIPLEAHMLPNGNIKVTFCKNPKGRVRDTAVEIDQNGTVLRQLPCFGRPLQMLPSGNELVRVQGGRVVELDPKGKAVWSHGRAGREINWVQRLPNGDTLVATRTGSITRSLRVIRPNGTTVWSKNVGYVSQAHRY